MLAQSIGRKKSLRDGEGRATSAKKNVKWLNNASMKVALTIESSKILVSESVECFLSGIESLLRAQWKNKIDFDRTLWLANPSSAEHESFIPAVSHNNGFASGLEPSRNWSLCRNGRTTREYGRVWIDGTSESWRKGAMDTVHLTEARYAGCISCCLETAPNIKLIHEHAIIGVVSAAPTRQIQRRRKKWVPIYRPHR